VAFLATITVLAAAHIVGALRVYRAACIGHRYNKRFYVFLFRSRFYVFNVSTFFLIFEKRCQMQSMNMKKFRLRFDTHRGSFASNLEQAANLLCAVVNSAS